MSWPDWLYELLKDPEEHDSEHGRSCHFCKSSHGRYDQPLEHYIDCSWLIAATHAGIDLTGHTVFEPKPSPACEVCGWYYDSPEDWRGWRMRARCSGKMREAHDRHRCAEHGITYEEFLAGPYPPGLYPGFGFDGRMAWEMKWMQENWFKHMTTRFTERGGISVIAAPDLSDEAIRETGA